MDGGQQLCNCRSFLSKAMLTVNQNIFGLKKFHDMAMYNMFQDFACDARKRDRSIIPTLPFFSFFEYSMDVGFFHLDGNSS